jgi:transcriptional regulator
VEALTREHEGKRDAPWAVTDAPADFIEKLVAAVVGIELSITRLVGKWKVSQNRSISDRVGVVEALEREAVPSGTSIAALIRQTLDGGE